MIAVLEGSEVQKLRSSEVQ